MMTRPFQALMTIGTLDIQLGIIIILYIPAILWIMSRVEKFFSLVWRDKLLLLLIGFALLSVFWSVARTNTLRAFVFFLGATLFGVFLAMRYSLREQMYLFAWVFGLVLFFNLVVILLFPQIAAYKTGSVSAWSGIYNHKNALGRYTAISAVLFWLLFNNRRIRWIMITCFILAMGILVGSRSATSLLAVIFVIGLLPLYRLLRTRDTRQSLAVISLLILIMGAAAFIFTFYLDFDATADLFFTSLGRNPDKNTFDVRLVLWDVVLKKVQDRPLFGYGFGDAWANDPNGGYQLVLYGNIWEPKQAHNGYLETLLELGSVGLVAIVFYLMLGLRRGMILSIFTRTSEGLWILAYLTLLIIFNFSYSILMGQLTVPWTIFVTVMLSARLQLSRISLGSAATMVGKMQTGNMNSA